MPGWVATIARASFTRARRSRSWRAAARSSASRESSGTGVAKAKKETRRERELTPSEPSSPLRSGQIAPRQVAEGTPDGLCAPPL